MYVNVIALSELSIDSSEMFSVLILLSATRWQLALFELCWPQEAKLI